MRNIWNEYKNDFIKSFKVNVQELRADPLFKQDGYDAVVIVTLDPAGEWGPYSDELHGLGVELGIKFAWTPGDGHKNQAAYNEIMIRHWTRRVKATMIEYTIPVSYMQEVGDFITLVDNCLAMNRDLKGQRGGGPTTNERASRGRIDRSDDAHVLHHAVSVGRLALVTKKALASDMTDTHNELLVSVGMDGDCPVWENPYHGGLRRSKNYFIIDLPRGVNWLHMLRLPLLKVNNAGRHPDAPQVGPACAIVLDVTDLNKYAVKAVRRVEEFNQAQEQFRGVLSDNTSYITIMENGECYAADGCTRVHPPPEGDDVTTKHIMVSRGADMPEAASARRYEEELDRIESDPESFVGTEVWVRFPMEADGGRDEHRGVITGTWRRGPYTYWQVLYDDGDKEDWTRHQVRWYVVDGYSTRFNSGEEPRVSVPADRVNLDGSRWEATHATGTGGAAPQARNTHHSVRVGGRAVDYTKGVGDGDMVDPYARAKARVSINVPRNVRWARRFVHERGARVYTVQRGDTLLTIARKIQLDAACIGPVSYTHLTLPTIYSV